MACVIPHVLSKTPSMESNSNLNSQEIKNLYQKENVT